MACGSCGGARANRTMIGSDGRRVSAPRKSKYVWFWLGTEGEEKTFESERQAREWVKSGNPGSLRLGPVVE